MDRFQRQKNSVVKNSTSSCVNSCERATKSEFYDPELQLIIPHVAILVKIFIFFLHSCVLCVRISRHIIVIPKISMTRHMKESAGIYFTIYNHSHSDHALERISHVVWSLFRIALLISDCQTHIKNIFHGIMMLSIAAGWIIYRVNPGISWWYSSYF